MTADAQKKAMEGALADGMATMNVAYAKLMLKNGSAATAEIAAYANSNSPASEEFSYTFSSDGVVTIGGRAGSDFANAISVTKTWEKP